MIECHDAVATKALAKGEKCWVWQVVEGDEKVLLAAPVSEAQPNERAFVARASRALELGEKGIFTSEK